MSGGLVLDAGGLIAVDRADRRVAVLLARAAETDATLVVPATALAQVIRRPDRQVRLVRLIRRPATRLVALDRTASIAVGRLLAASGTADVVDAHVAVCARAGGHAVVTSDPGDIGRLDPALRLLAV